MKKLILIITLLGITLDADALMVDQIRAYYGQTTVAPVAAPRVTPKSPYEGSQVVQRNKEDGYYLDERNQIPEYARIKPPHEENIPTDPRPVRTVVPFDTYYEINRLGYRRPDYLNPVVPGYNRFYSERRAYPYTKKEFVDVWCTGKKFENGVDCQSENYAITFIRARDWAWGTIKAPFKARKAHLKTAIFVMVDDLALDAQYMHDIKNYGELFNIQVWFGTVDCYIPSNWII